MDSCQPLDGKNELANYEYPSCLIEASLLGKISRHKNRNKVITDKLTVIDFHWRKRMSGCRNCGKIIAIAYYTHQIVNLKPEVVS